MQPWGLSTKTSRYTVPGVSMYLLPAILLSLDMKDGGFRYVGDISQGNTFARWSTPAISTFDNVLLALLHRSRSGFPGTIERGFSPTFGVPPRPKWQIIHAHSLSGRFSTLVRPKILARSSRPWASPFSSRSVTVRGLFLPYLLQIEIPCSDPGYVSFCNSKNGFQPLRVTDRDVIVRPLTMSRSVTIRRVFSPLVLRIETNLKPGGSQTR